MKASVERSRSGVRRGLAAMELSCSEGHEGNGGTGAWHGAGSWHRGLSRLPRADQGHGRVVGQAFPEAVGQLVS